MVVYIFIMGCAYGIGTILHARYKAAAAALDSMAAVAADMANTLRLAPVSVAELFAAYSGQGPFARAFAAMAESVESGQEGAQAVFEREIRASGVELSAENLEIVLSVGAALGLPDRDRVVARLDLAAGRLSEALEAAVAARDKDGRMAQRLSLVAGMFLIILIW
jgi:stage III sporulation protein AB